MIKVNSPRNLNTHFMFKKHILPTIKRILAHQGDAASAGKPISLFVPGSVY